MLNVERLLFDSLRLVRWTFQDVGDQVPMHAHREGGEHISILVKGRVLCRGENWEFSLDTPGKIADFVPGQPHSFIAQEADTVVINVYKVNEGSDTEGFDDAF